jgi:hypothetical protein
MSDHLLVSETTLGDRNFFQYVTSFSQTFMDRIDSTSNRQSNLLFDSVTFENHLQVKPMDMNGLLKDIYDDERQNTDVVPTNLRQLARGSFCRSSNIEKGKLSRAMWPPKPQQMPVSSQSGGLVLDATMRLVAQRTRDLLLNDASHVPRIIKIQPNYTTGQ